MAVAVRNRIKSEFGISIPVIKFFEGQNILDLAQLIAEKLLLIQQPDTIHLSNKKTQDIDVTPKNTIDGNLIDVDDSDS